MYFKYQLHIKCHCENGFHFPLSHRHDSYLAYIVDTLMATQPEHITIHADLEWCRFNCGTVPAELVLTGQKPEHITIHADLEGCHANGSTVLLPNQGLPGGAEHPLGQRGDRNKKRYTYLCSDIEAEGCTCHNFPLKIGVRGFVTTQNTKMNFVRCLEPAKLRILIQ